MNSNREGKPESVEPEMLLRMVELEMMQKRAARQQASARRNSWRAASFFFLDVPRLSNWLSQPLEAKRLRVLPVSNEGVQDDNSGSF